MLGLASSYPFDIIYPMKNKSHSSEDIYFKVETLCEDACKPESEQALDTYLKGEVHVSLLISTGFVDRLEEEIRHIKAGKPSPHPFFICCNGCFENILTETLEYSYSAIGCDHEPEDPYWSTVNLSRAPKDPKRLKAFLLKHGCAWNATRHVAVWKDIQSRDEYVGQLRKLFESAASLAKGLGCDEAATDLLEALRLTFPRPTGDDVMSHKIDQISALMTREQAQSLYEVGTRGLARLWVASQYAALTPLRPLTKKHSTRKTA